MSFFDFGTETNGNFEQTAGGDFKPIPKDTVVKVIAENAKWSQFEPHPEYVEIQWQVTEGEFKNRKIFQKLKTQDPDPQKAKKAMMMLGAINHNANGNLDKLVHKPTDQELNNALTFKPMFLKLGVWEITTENGDKKEGNWVVAVSSQGASQPQAQRQQPVQTVDLDSDLPF